MLKCYEGLYILDSAVTEDKMKDTVRAVEELIKQLKGTVEKTDEWGNKKLPHSIRGKKEAQFYLIHFSMPPGALVELRKSCQLKESILRFSIFKTGGNDK